MNFYHNLITLKVKSAIELKAVDLAAKQADIVGGMNVCALGRSFYSLSLTNSPGELHLQNPLFGCDDLLRSTCSVSVVLFLLILSLSIQSSKFFMNFFTLQVPK